MNDYIIRGTAANDQVRFFAAYTKDVVETARQKHNTSPVATAALGRLLTAGAMMGSMCKNDSDVITLQIQCSGPIGGLTVTADSKANVKGYVNNPDVMLPPSKRRKIRRWESIRSRCFDSDQGYWIKRALFRTDTFSIWRDCRRFNILFCGK